MYKIGIIGTENTHALAFAKIIRAQYAAMACVTGVWGEDRAASQKLLDEAGAGYIAGTAAELLGRVDAVMITARRGSQHRQLALPFIEAGVPLFVDKPFTSNVAQAEELAALAKEKQVLVMGGSGCKYLAAVQQQRRAAKALLDKGELQSASLNFAVQADSPYDGLYFYAPHLVEMCLAMFGTGMKSVIARENDGTILVLAAYPKLNVCLHFTARSKQSFSVLYGRDEVLPLPIALDNLYENEVAQFIAMLNGKAMPQTYDELVLPVRVIAAIEAALASGEETPIFT